MKRMTASRFKSHCLSVMNAVVATGERVLITKRGKPYVRIERVEPDAKSIFGFMAGECKIVGDIEGPVVPLHYWNTVEENRSIRRRSSRRAPRKS